jgi:hypothetical protein
MKFRDGGVAAGFAAGAVGGCAVLINVRGTFLFDETSNNVMKTP